MNCHQFLISRLLGGAAAIGLEIASGVPEVVEDGDTGFLIPAQDPRGYADRIQALLQNPALYRRITEDAFERVQRDHAWKQYVEATLTEYRQLLEKRAENLTNDHH
jgi:glycosyltransferase involved in cell wall biosynthesis